MKIAAIQSIRSARPIDSGNTIAVELVDGAEGLWSVLIPATIVRDLVPMLEAAGEEAAEMRQVLGRD